MLLKSVGAGGKNGLILAFFSSNVLRIAPPLTIDREELEKEINIVRNEHNQKSLNFKDHVKEKEINISLNDKQCALFYENEREKTFVYTAPTACEDYSFVSATYVDAGNKHDSRTFYEIYNKINERFEDDLENISIL